MAVSPLTLFIQTVIKSRISYTFIAQEVRQVETKARSTFLENLKGA